MSPDDKVAIGCFVFVALMVVVSIIKGNKKSNRRLYSKYTQPEKGIKRY